MKSFMLATVLIVLTVLAVIWNAVYINRVGNEIRSMLSAIPDVRDSDCAVEVNEMGTYWESQLKWVNLSVNRRLSSRITENLVSLIACTESQDSEGFCRFSALLELALKDLMDAERVSFSLL